MKKTPAVIITTKNLSIWYNGFQALKTVSLGLPEHQITALIGPSGSGKSTFLRSLNRMLELIPQTRLEGSIFFKKESILRDTIDVTLLRRKIGMVFQNPTPFPKSIYDNVAYGLEIAGMKKHHRWVLFGQKPTAQDLQQSQDPIDATVVASLKEANLWDEVQEKIFMSAFRLSGGQQQRLCIARAIAIRPEVLLLDEPCSELDPISTKKIEALLVDLKKQYTIVIVTHNLYQAKRIADYVGFFNEGELIEFGPTKKLFTSATKKLTKNYITGAFG